MVCELEMDPKPAGVLGSAGKGGREQVRAELPDGGPEWLNPCIAMGTSTVPSPVRGGVG